MALLRKSLNEFRTRRLSPEHSACVLAAGPDTVIPPVGREELALVLAAVMAPGGARILPAARPPAVLTHEPAAGRFQARLP